MTAFNPEACIVAARLLQIIEEHPDWEVHPDWVPHLKAILEKQDCSVLVLEPNLRGPRVKASYP